MSIKSFLIAISTYSAIPVPQFEWNERNWQYAICWFPCVGLISGGLEALWIWLSAKYGLSPVLFACISVCIPLFVTGGIHMDGYMDTVDAIASHQSREKKLEIMKDSSSGAFSVIYCCVYFLLSFGLFYELGPSKAAYIICPAYVYSRTLSAYCAVTMPNARGSGMLNSFTEGLDKNKALTAVSLFALAAAALMICTGRLTAIIPVFAGLLVMIWYRLYTDKQFGGCTGDTEGFFLQICELVMLASILIAERIV